MNNYIFNKLRAEAQHLCLLAENEAKISHRGVKGRFREILVSNILSPWLPPDANQDKEVFLVHDQ